MATQKVTENSRKKMQNHRSWTFQALVSSLRDLLFLSIVTFVFALGFSGCSNSPTIKHYSLHGKIMSVDKMGHELIIDHDAIPGFMEAMTMPYEVTDDKFLNQVSPGDEIRADLQIQGDKIAIDQLQVLAKAPPGSTPVQPKPMHVPEVGEKVPNFILTNQNGKRIHLSDYRGKTMLITFFYTRCTLNDYCPRMNSNFATVDKALAKNPELYAKTHLISISFDPQHDTPEVLRSYGAAYTERYVKEDFKHWEFATSAPEELNSLADFFGVYYEKDGNSITHSLSTAVIGPDGAVKAWYPGNRWQPEEALQAVNAATASSEPVHVASSQPASKDSKQR
jgi:protein SCO1/2